MYSLRLAARSKVSSFFTLALPAIVFSTNALAATTASTSSGTTISADPNKLQTELPPEKTLFNKLRERIGINYFSFWDGPTLDGFQGFTPNDKGKPLDKGLSLFNLISVKYRFSNSLSLDVQNRIQWIHTRQPELRFQAPRLGVSGVLMSGADWRLAGAVNTDIPGTGYIVTQRTIMFNPGTFANFSYTPRSTRWSLFAIVSPRVWFYSDRQAVEPQWIAEGLRPGQKPEAVFSITPTANYAITENLGARAGFNLDYRKFVESSWGEWKRWRTPVTAGVTYKFNKHLEVYPYVNTFPIDGPGLTARTSSLGMWLSGTIL